MVWEKEFKENPNAVMDRIAEFSVNKLSEVLSVSTERYSGIVHNLEVEEDNSYVTPAAVVIIVSKVSIRQRNLMWLANQYK